MRTVLKQFSTPLSFFPVGRQFDPAELDGPVSLEDWQANGFVDRDPPPAPAPALPVAPDAIAQAEAELAAAQQHLRDAEAAAPAA